MPARDDCTTTSTSKAIRLHRVRSASVEFPTKTEIVVRRLASAEGQPTEEETVTQTITGEEGFFYLQLPDGHRYRLEASREGETGSIEVDAPGKRDIAIGPSGE